MDLLEAIANTAGGCSCCEQANTYYVYDGNAPEEHQKKGGLAHLLTVKEQAHKEIADILCRACCNPWHKMDLIVTNEKTQAEVFKIERPFKGCGCACFPCCLQDWIVQGSDSSVIGHVTQPLFGGFFCPKFSLVEGEDEKADPFWFLKGPHCIGELCCSVEFNVVDAKNEDVQIGQVNKLAADNATEACKQVGTDADRFEMNFAKDTSPQKKAIMMTSMVLLDYYFFESGGAFACNPLAGPGDECCHLNLCTQYCCGTKLTYSCALNNEAGGGE